LNAGKWDAADQTAALMTAYRSLQELDIVIDLSDSTALQAIKALENKKVPRGWLTVLLGLLALIAIGGLIPFWLFIYFFINR
jgi:ABC-type sugar transport system substrate-binding protein